MTKIEKKQKIDIYVYLSCFIFSVQSIYVFYTWKWYISTILINTMRYMSLQAEKASQDISIVIVDLDGTLILSDSLFEQLAALLRHPCSFLRAVPGLIAACMHSKSAFKECLAFHSTRYLAVDTLPFSAELLDLLNDYRARSFKIYLCTGAHISVASMVADHLAIFDGVMASHADLNLVGRNKAQALIDQFGEKSFIYAGNSSADLHVWNVSSSAVIVNASAQLLDKVSQFGNVETIVRRPSRGIRTWIRALRVHQWIKNFLVFAPLIASHQFFNPGNWLACIVTFLCFGCVASSVYLQNDLLDLPSDRLHLRKRLRPFASGLLPLEQGMLLAPVLLSVGLLGAWFQNLSVFAWLTAYFLLTFAYSIHLKKLVLLDCIVLALLYTLRIVAGAASIHNQLSHWLLGFSFFLFFSLAMMKRYAELETKSLLANKEIIGRGYRPADMPLVLGLGLSSAFCSILVLSLYLNSDQVIKLYQFPEFIWAGVPVMLFWVSWMWLKAHRGEMLDDPVLFAAKDKLSLISVLVLGFVLIVATLGL